MAKQVFIHATHALQIVTELSNIQIDAISQAGERDVAQHLKNLRDAMWGKVSVAGDFFKVEEPLPQEQREAIFKESLQGLDTKQQALLIDSYAKMGNLYEISAISARSNYFDEIKKDPRDRAVEFGGIDEFIYNNEKNPKAKKVSLDEWIEKLNQPVFEMTFTAHPTNVNGLESMKAQREICKAMEIGDKEAVVAAVTNYQNTPLLHKGGTNLTVRDETENTLYFLGNIYEDLKESYRRYDEPLEKKAKKDGVEYDKTALDLQVKLGAWGSSGDKDGNKNVTAETTLEAIALHTQAALTHYVKDLENITTPELSGWKNLLAEKKDALEPVLKEIEQLRADAKDAMEGKATANPTQLNERFDTLSEKLIAVREGLDSKKFTDDIKAAYDTHHDQESLDLLRRARTFGFSFGKIEYRETAEEYARVVEELVSKQLPKYTELSPEEKATALTSFLQSPENVAAKSLANMAGEIAENGAGKAYSDKDAMPIAYHSIKRMALARDFPDMIKDNVLAECGQLPEGVKPDADGKNVAAQGVANLLEAQFLQKAVEKEGKRAKLGIVPLFEEPDTMKHIDKIMGAAYENPEHKKQLELLQGNSEQPTQQVQIAHSDNARRSGLQAARAYIHEAHKKMQAVNEQYGINTEFFEGGSVSDAYRNGVRAISANVDSFGLHKFAKMTFQGGDLLNYFNHPDSTARLIYRQLSHQAEGLEKMPNGKWRSVEASKSQNEVMDEVAIKALKEMLGDYQKHDFTQDTMGTLLGVLVYDKEVVNSNSSSRAGGRGVLANAVDEVIDGVKNLVKIVAVKIDKVRTIGFSKAWQNNGIVPSWIGSGTLREELEKYTQEKYTQISNKSHPTSDEQDFEDMVKQSLGKDGNVHLNPKLLQAFYKNSNTFKDAQDRAVFAIALSDMNAADKIIGKKFASADMSDIPTAKVVENAESYFERVKQTFESAASLAYEAVTGKDFVQPQTVDLHQKNNEIESQIIKALPNLNGEFERKKNYSDFIMYLRSEKPEIFDDQNLARTVICAGDTVNHGRWLGASDNTYIQSRLPNKDRGMAA